MLDVSKNPFAHTAQPKVPKSQLKRGQVTQKKRIGRPATDNKPFLFVLQEHQHKELKRATTPYGFRNKSELLQAFAEALCRLSSEGKQKALIKSDEAGNVLFLGQQLF